MAHLGSPSALHDYDLYEIARIDRQKLENGKNSKNE